MKPAHNNMARRFAALLMVLLLLCAAAVAQGDPSDAVQLRLEMYLVTVEDGQETFTASITARPGQVVEYRILATNTSNEELQPGSVVVTVPVPGGARFLANSAAPVSQEVLVEYTAEGAGYMEPPVIIEIEADGSRRTASQDEYRGVRWTLLNPMAPNAEVVLSFRVTVE